MHQKVTYFGGEIQQGRGQDNKRGVYVCSGADHNFYIVLSQLKRNSSKEPRRERRQIYSDTKVLKSESANDSPETLRSAAL